MQVICLTLDHIAFSPSISGSYIEQCLSKTRESVLDSESSSDESDCDSNCYSIDKGSITIEVPAAATDGHAQVFFNTNFFSFSFSSHR